MYKHEENFSFLRFS